MAREYDIKVSAVLSRSTRATVGEFVASWKKAIAEVEAALGRMGDRAPRRARAAAAGGEAEVAAAKKTAKDAADAKIKEAKRAQAELDRIRERENNQILREVAQQERARERAEKHVANVRDRHFAQQQREQERADNQNAGRNRRIASDAMNYTKRALGAAARVGGEVLGGMGVSFDISSAIGRGVSLESMATAITNSGNRGGAGAAARDAQPKELVSLARDIGNKYAMDPTQVLSGLSQFQALTGDLDTGLAGLDEQARLAKAFNTDLSDMVATAGQVSSALGEVGEGKEFATVADKARAVNDILRTMVAQGQEGAIEFSDLAIQMAKLKAAGTRFEGSTAESIKRMGVLTQLSMQHGGASSAAEASRAVLGFANTLATPARRAQFKAAGVDIDSKTERGAFADPFEIIRRSLIATGGDIEPMKKLFSSVIGDKPVIALSKKFRDAGGGEAGIAAVNKEIARFSGTVTDAQIDENNARALKTKGSEAQTLQNQFDKSMADMTDRLMPQMMRLAPVIASTVEAFASVVTWAASNPLAAVGATIAASVGASIAKAAIGDAIGKAIASGVGSRGLAIGALTATVAYALMSVQKYDEAKKGATEEVKEGLTDNAAFLKSAQAEMAAKGTLSADTRAEFIKRYSKLTGTIAAGQREGSGDLNFFEAIGANITDTFRGRNDMEAYAQLEGRTETAKTSMPELQKLADQFAALADTLKASAPKKGEVQHVVIDNLPAGGVAADSAGRAAQ